MTETQKDSQHPAQGTVVIQAWVMMNQHNEGKSVWIPQGDLYPPPTTDVKLKFEIVQDSPAVWKFPEGETHGGFNNGFKLDTHDEHHEFSFLERSTDGQSICIQDKNNHKGKYGYQVQLVSNDGKYISSRDPTIRNRSGG